MSDCNQEPWHSEMPLAKIGELRYRCWYAELDSGAAGAYWHLDMPEVGGAPLNNVLRLTFVAPVSGVIGSVDCEHWQMIERIRVKAGEKFTVTINMDGA